MIYQILFCSQEPIHISGHNPKSSKVGEDESHELGLVVPCLRTCRQVYWEAVSILYGNNTWLITRPRDLHDQIYHQIQYAPTWMRGIGSNFDLIK
ncbi:hypothetical protein P171DRAFT_427122 [Karstenula rhodostoma CBS 690.94]|uniref:Uncharacterized protein n=1 Tax=Karstenula rhodostoma CBS 690.94 TaxID=1392251 RepID=A0A9P4PXR4_9PLEO|nr:hypothetical protein P171DRAFT_427122 [Karstenula rhodostoma CBS 690.94]